MTISLADAKKIIQGVLAAQAENNFKPMAVVVLTAGGTIRASESQDGTSPLRPKIAHGKAMVLWCLLQAVFCCAVPMVP